MGSGDCKRCSRIWQRGWPHASWPGPGHRSPGRNAVAFCSAAWCSDRGGGPRELPGGATRAQAGLAALGFRDGGQRVGSDIGAHAPAAFRRQAGGDGALVALAAQGAAQRVHAGGSDRGRCRERHAVQCRAASHGQGARGYGCGCLHRPNSWGLPKQIQQILASPRPVRAADLALQPAPQPPWGGTRKFSVMRFSARRSAPRTRTATVRAQRCRQTAMRR